MRVTQGIVGMFGLLAACTGTIGSDGETPTDPMQPTRTEVRVSVKDANAPQAGVRVLFQNPDDSLLLDAVTDANGIATAEMTAGNVTVVRTYPVELPTPPEGQRAPEVFTYIGVKGGDLLQLGNEEPVTEPTPGAVIVKVPDEAEGTVTVKTSCGSGAGTGPNIAITVNNCPAMMDLYVTDGAGSSYYMKQPYAENIDTSAGVLQSKLGSTITSTNVPLDSTVDAEHRLVAGSFTIYSSGNKRIETTPANINVPDISGVDQLVIAHVQTANMGRQMVADRRSYDGSPVVVDAGIHLIPYVSELQYETPDVTWVETGTGSVDAVLVRLDVSRHVPEGTTEPLDNDYVRMIIAPHGGLTFRIPAVPEPRYNPSMLDQVATSHALVKSTGGYDALRANAFMSTSVLHTGAVDSAITLSYAGNAPSL